MAQQRHCRNYSIVGGPSKFDLMLALFDSTREKPRSVGFEISSEGPHFEKIEVGITAVSHKGGSGEDWNFAGVMASDAWPDTVSAYFNTIPRSKLAIRGYFSTKTRQGSMTVEKEERK